MSSLAQYSFLPWLRQGLGTRITETDTLGIEPANIGDLALERAELTVSLNIRHTSIVDSSVQETEEQKTVKLIGPGDIIGIRKDAIVRTEPQDGTLNFEAGTLPYIEFYEEDLPWRYTPASPVSGDNHISRLRPWIALVVLQNDEFTLYHDPKGLSCITIKESCVTHVLPPHQETWAWAHVHFNCRLQATTHEALLREIAEKLHKDPDVAVARLLCPRKLQINTAYHGFLIPTFETGRLAGLQEDPQGIPAQQPSWNSSHMPVSDIRPFDFPVYYHWTFQTGEHGDFETLVRLLKATVTRREMGERPMNIAAPGLGLDGVADSTTIGLEGALKPPALDRPQWPGTPGDREFTDKLTHILNISEDVQNEGDAQNNLPPNPYYSQEKMCFYAEKIPDDPIVVPPIYGKWHALIKRLGEQSNPQWVESLNRDPRDRAVAGLGTRIIQEKQEEFMEMAWQQIGAVNDANQKIREAELAQMTSTAIYEKHIHPLDEDTLISITSAAHPSILNSDVSQTIQHQIQTSQIPLAAVSAAFKRIIRPGKKCNKRMNQHGNGASLIHKHVIQNFNLEKTGRQSPLTAAETKKAPEMAITVEAIQGAIQHVINGYTQHPLVRAREAFMRVLIDSQLPEQNLEALKQQLQENISEYTLPEEIREPTIQCINNITKYETMDTITLVSLEKNWFREIFGTGVNGRVRENVVVKEESASVTGYGIKPMTFLEDVEVFQSDFERFRQNVISKLISPESLELPPIASLQSVSESIKAKLHPAFSMQKKLTHSIKVWSREINDFVFLESLRPIMAYPEFSMPVYEHLKNLSQEYILPNIGNIEDNTITLLENNQRFIEALMTGLNHEMARELLWREYPTDQRGSYFRKFWDTKDSLFSEQEELYDIPPLHTWRRDLGNHNTRDKNMLVLLIRGELLQKYPNTIVYAQKAAFDEQGKELPRVLSDTSVLSNFKFPIIRGNLDPNITILGFDLDKVEAKGNHTDNPGWFFVLKERPGQLTFALDDNIDIITSKSHFPDTLATKWNDLSWGHLVDTQDELNSLRHIILLSDSGDIRRIRADVADSSVIWGTNSADMAYILFQTPVLFARHAQELLP